jgi:hypothetical protein
MASLEKRIKSMLNDSDRSTTVAGTSPEVANGPASIRQPISSGKTVFHWHFLLRYGGSFSIGVKVSKIIHEGIVES